MQKNTSLRIMATDDKRSDDEKALRKVLATMDVQRKAMENEADAIYLELTTPPEEGLEPMGVDTPLVDNEGYPRGDIDVYRARTLRNRFRVLQTDHREISGKIEALLLQLAALKDPSKAAAEEVERTQRLAPKPKPKYDAATGKWVVMNWDGSVAGIQGGEEIKFRDLTREVSKLTDPSVESGSHRTLLSLGDLTSASHASAGSGNLPMVEEAALLPFSRVNAVATDSPAEGAGLKEDDLIVKFGNLNVDNHNHLKAIAALVPEVAAENGEIEIQVLRRAEDSNMTQGESNQTISGSEQDYNNPLQWEQKTVSLKPRPWSGRGLIGCHIVPHNV
jgi:26S proteasome non-ATPase regulatory subunit 9